MSSNAFSAADMTTAAANGHRDGYQAGYADAVKAVEVGKPAAAQEAVAYLDIGAGGYLDLGSNLPEVQLLALPKGRHALGIIGTYGIDGYASAPVVAAPVDTWFADQLTAMGEVIPLGSTPAAQGIDLEQFRKAVTTYRNFCRANEPEGDRLLALIDASPKGGSDDAWRSMDAAPKSVADGNRVEGVYLLGFIPDDDLVDPQACIDVIWWEPLLPNSKGGRGKWCANRFGEAYEVVPTKWQHLPEVQATSAEVGA